LEKNSSRSFGWESSISGSEIDCRKRKEIEAFKPEEYWEIWGTFLSQEGKKRELLAKLVKENGKNLAIDKEKLAKETLTC